MNLTKREFFKRKNRKQLYNIYENAVENSYELSNDYFNNLETLNEYKSEFRNNTYIWDMLEAIEYNVTHSSHLCSATRCQQLKSTPYKVDALTYGILLKDINKLSAANGQMRGLFNILDYLKREELGIRSV